MRIGVIRGDMSGPVTLMDLEPVSQYNPSTEPRGQERNIDRPDSAVVGLALASIGAGLQGTTDRSAGVTIDGTNDDLRIKTASAASFTAVSIAQAVYASGTTLVAALNAALTAGSVDATASMDDTGTYVVIRSNTTGVGSYLEVDTVGNGSTFNNAIGLPAGGDAFEVPAASAVITATLPVGGPLDVSTATLVATVGPATSAQLTAVADAIAPRFVETDVAIKSFQVGMISGFRSASWNPDPNRLPAFPNGSAISVVQDDGVTPFVAPLTVVSGAASNSPNGGDITITGTNLGDSEVEATVVRVTSSDGSRFVKLFQSQIVSTLSGGTQGSVTATSIVIPASLLSSLGVAGSKVQVQYTSFASNVFTVT